MTDLHDPLRDDTLDDDDLPEKLFVFPLARSVIFPGMVQPINLPPGPLLDTVERARAHNDYLGFVFSSDDEADSPSVDTLARIGTVGRIVRTARLPEGGYTLLVESIKRMRVVKFLRAEHLIAQVEYLDDEVDDTDELQALWRNIQRSLARLVDLNPQLPKELVGGILAIDEPGELADMVAAHFPMPVVEKQALLELLDVKARLEAVYTHLVREMDLIELGQRIHDQIRDRIEESQREFFLREQLKVIRRELGEERDETSLNLETYAERIAKANMPDEARARAEEQLERLAVLTPEAAEYNMIRTYLDWLVDLPWSAVSDDNLDLRHADAILDRDHFGLKDVKERIVEFLAVKKLKPEQQGQIICFVGPPGVGKTSLGRSITEALGRQFFRFSLGGMRDEAEIKGHRRTYIGAMPGKIIQGLKRVGTRNPVFMLDEIDKLGSDWRGDPSSAMLEVLDPAQNNSFLDHYLDVPFDLSSVMFIATANNTATIPQPLLDRMEVIRIAGYIDEEKFQIARRHLVPRQREAHGLRAEQLSISDAAIRRMVRGYTMEAGVRNLDRVIAKVCRKVAATIAREEAERVSVSVRNVEKYLGPPAFEDEVIKRGQAPGIAVGLAWTQAGGAVMFVETTKMPGRERLKITGTLGDVMTESVQIAYSYVRANMASLGISEDVFKATDFHVHFPDGATPKDGPSAGITIVCSLLSLLRGRRLPSRLAMTGEVTLVGNVLPVGGIKEKVTAARRAGAATVILPERNRKDLAEVPDHVRDALTFHFVSTFKDVDAIVFGEEASGTRRRGRSNGRQGAAEEGPVTEDRP